jgi:hypothetical protein
MSEYLNPEAARHAWAEREKGRQEKLTAAEKQRADEAITRQFDLEQSVQRGQKPAPFGSDGLFSFSNAIARLRKQVGFCAYRRAWIKETVPEGSMYIFIDHTTDRLTLFSIERQKIDVDGKNLQVLGDNLAATDWVVI